jgi:transposase
MTAAPSVLEACPASPSAARAVPFATVNVTLTKQEHIRLVMEANSWKNLHVRAVERARWRDQRYRRVLRQLKTQAAQREAVLRAELEFAQAKIRDLQQRVFGRKSERRKGGSEQQVRGLATRTPRGQQRGSPGHGRTMLAHLPERVEVVQIETPQCPQCGLPLSDFPGTEDSEVLEIEVQAYRRVIRRRRYRPSCDCGCVPGIVAAPTPARLIERGKFGVSIWTSVLLDKFLYGRPSHRLLQELADRGLTMSPGTLSGGLAVLAPLFEPLEQALVRKLRGQAHWHADETRWAVFVELAGKVGHRWYLWVFHSSAVVHYVLDESRSAEVLEAELAGVQRGVISCDRYSAYKKFARLHPGVVLAFCWAHQRRDFLELANAYPEVSAWAMQWVDAIAELYRLNTLRLQAAASGAERATHQTALRRAMQRMAIQRDAALADPQLAQPAAKVLQSMVEHWPGLTVFVKRPWVPMDNNTAERDARLAVVGRKNFYGSGSLWSGQLAATMYSLLMTARLWGLNARTWLGAYLQACGDNGNRAPSHIDAFLPWAMDATRLAVMRACAPGAGEVIQGSEGIDSS